MNELFDYGRPAQITLVALVDRGGREMPIQAQIIGTSIQLDPTQNLELARDDAGTFHLKLIGAA
jgi:pyrimidine operon attenuation protein/uracil phosphoribosyltransferase